MSTATTIPIWFCIWCGGTSLDPCNHPAYRFAWDDALQPVNEAGELIRDGIEAKLKEGGRGRLENDHAR